MATHTKTKAPSAAAVVEAAAGLATTTIALAAGEATKTLALAADTALQTLATAAIKAVSDFPRLQDDIRELRQAHVSDVAVVTAAVTDLILSHTRAEELRLGTIADSVRKIDEHLEKQNGRLAKVETQSTRQNLVIFGALGPAALAAFGWALVKYF